MSCTTPSKCSKRKTRVRLQKLPTLLTSPELFFCHQVSPVERGICGLRADADKIEPPYIGIDTRSHGVIPENPYVARLGELLAFVVEVLDSNKMVDKGELFPGSQLHRWHEDRVERNVIFSHELEEFHILGVFPPLLPIVLYMGLCNG